MPDRPKTFDPTRLAAEMCVWSGTPDDTSELAACQRLIAGQETVEAAWTTWHVEMATQGRVIAAAVAAWKASMAEILPSAGPHFLSVAVASLEEGDEAEALAALRMASTLDPTSQTASQARELMEKAFVDGGARMVRGDQASAEESSAWLELGGMYGHTNRHEVAEQVFRTAVGVHPEDSTLWSALGVAVGSQGREEESESHFRKALELDGENVHALLQLGVTWARMDRLDEAEEAFENATRIDPCSVHAWTHLGRVRVDQDRAGRAVEPYEKAVELDPTMLEAWEGLAYALIDAGRHGKAQKVLDEALDALPGDADLLVAYGVSAAEQGRHDEARKRFEEAIASEPRHGGALANAAINELNRGNLAEAERLARVTVERLEDWSGSYVLLGDVLEECGDLAGAEQAWRKAVDLDPTDSEARERLEDLQ